MSGQNKIMTIEQYNGWIRISTMLHGQLVTRRYLYYTLAQAKKLFKEELKTLK